MYIISQQCTVLYLYIFYGWSGLTVTVTECTVVISGLTYSVQTIR